MENYCTHISRNRCYIIKIFRVTLTHIIQIHRGSLILIGMFVIHTLTPRIFILSQIHSIKTLSKNDYYCNKIYNLIPPILNYSGNTYRVCASSKCRQILYMANVSYNRRRRTAGSPTQDLVKLGDPHVRVAQFLWSLFRS